MHIANTAYSTMEGPRGGGRFFYVGRQVIDDELNPPHHMYTLIFLERSHNVTTHFWVHVNPNWKNLSCGVMLRNVWWQMGMGSQLQTTS